jgi:hypothetical protein
MFLIKPVNRLRWLTGFYMLAFVLKIKDSLLIPDHDFRIFTTQKMNKNEQKRMLIRNTFAFTMKAQKYPYQRNSFNKFTFNSHGPNGIIKKVIKYDFLNELDDGTLLFNLGFGDYNGDDEDYSDLTISNNEDREKVLGTIAATVLDFTRHFKIVSIYAIGSTPSRTRLYQMGINAYLEEIQSAFHILGILLDEWKEFKRGVNYQAFVVTKKDH